MRFHKWEQSGYIDRKNGKCKIICKKCGTSTLSETGILVVTGNSDNNHSTIDRDCEKQEALNKIYSDVEDVVN
jgi:hypothetical protein